MENQLFIFDVMRSLKKTVLAERDVSFEINRKVLYQMKKVQDVNLLKLKLYSRNLAYKVKEYGFGAEHVLYVERVGLFIGAEVADVLGCSLSGIYASRSGSSLKSKVKIILRYLPRTITHFLRKIEIKSNVHKAKKERNVYIEKEYPPKKKKILLVDDAIDTGNSITTIIDHLEARGYDSGDIKVAVLTITRHTAKSKADFSLFDCTCAFPWSYDSREYDKAWELYSRLKSTM